MIKVKKEVDFKDLMHVHHNLWPILSFVIAYAKHFKLPLTITSITDEAAGRQSLTHATGRAFDLSVRGWSELHILSLQNKVNKKFKSIAAVSKDGTSRACVYHKVEGSAFHFHFQVAPIDKTFFDNELN